MKRIAILASGAGSNAANIIRFYQGSTQVNVVLIASNRADAGVLQIARDYAIPTFMLTAANFKNSDAFVRELEAMQVDLVVLAGFLWKVPGFMVARFPRRIINIHPSLLPKYGGQGMYGHHVHEAVKASGDSKSGITIHYVNEEYDSGAVIAQHEVDVSSHDSAQDIESKVRALEVQWFPAVIDSLVMAM